MNQLNGFELAGRPMKVGHVTEKQDAMARESLDGDEMERQGKTPVVLTTVICSVCLLLSLLGDMMRFS